MNIYARLNLLLTGAALGAVATTLAMIAGYTR